MAGDIPTLRSGAKIARFFKWNNPPATDDKQNNEQTASSSVLDQLVSSLYDNGSGDDEGKQGKNIRLPGHVSARTAPSKRTSCRLVGPSPSDAATTSRISGDAGPIDIRSRR